MGASAFFASAEVIGVDALRALQPGEGKVAAVFRRSFYIRGGGAWACIGGPDIGVGPLNIIVGLRCDWTTLVANGQPVRAEGDRVLIGAVPLGLARAAIWSPPPAPGWDPMRASAGLTNFDDLIRLHSPPAEGLGVFAIAGAAPASLEARAAAAPAAALAQWIAAPDGSGPEVLPLLGLGPGLTPSGDDYLAGILAILHAVGLTEQRNRLWQVLSPALPLATGEISRAHLECAAEGRLAARQHLILNALLDGDRDALESALRALAADSHTSSWDGLAGMVTALRAVLAGDARAAERGSCNKVVQLHTTW